MLISVYKWALSDVCGDDPLLLFAVALNAFGFAVFWTVGGLYLLADLTAPSWLKRYKVQPDMNWPLPLPLLRKLLSRVLFNQIIVGTLFSIAFGYLAFRVRGNPWRVEDIYWNPLRLLGDVICIALCEELGFYWSHRIMHDSAFLYQNIHKIHHEWRAPVAISAVYAHPIEHVVSNLSPIALGPLVSGCHAWLVFVWIGVAITQTLHGHSGYHLPFLPSPEAHDYHHYAFNNNFGPLSLFDRICKTNEKFIRSVQAKRHFMIKSLSLCARDYFPDPAKAE